MLDTLAWNEIKNAELKLRYGLGFERVAIALSENRLLEDRVHPNLDRYGHQRQLIVDINGYAWVVPYIQDEKNIFLKTMFPSRKATRRYLEKLK